MCVNSKEINNDFQFWCITIFAWPSIWIPQCKTGCTILSSNWHFEMKNWDQWIECQWSSTIQLVKLTHGNGDSWITAIQLAHGCFLNFWWAFGNSRALDDDTAMAKVQHSVTAKLQHSVCSPNEFHKVNNCPCRMDWSKSMDWWKSSVRSMLGNPTWYSLASVYGACSDTRSQQVQATLGQIHYPDLKCPERKYER